MSSEKTPRLVKLFRDRVQRLYRTWWFAHYGVGLLGLVAGVVLTALTSADVARGPSQAATLSVSWAKEYAWIVGIVAAVSTSLVTFLGPLRKAERYYSVWHLLDQAVLEYELGVIQLKTFIARVQQARRMLQVVDLDEAMPNTRTPTPPAKPPKKSAKRRAPAKPRAAGAELRAVEG
jgi:hypothetical protein